jgi:hypothetical protein
MNIFEGVYYFFQSEAFQNIVAILKPTCFIVIFTSLIVIIWALVKGPWLYWHISADFSNFLHGGPVEPETVFQKKWKKIKKRIASPSEANWKLAIIESEELIEQALSNMGYKGEGLREKLRGVDTAVIPNIPDLISSYDIFINILADNNYKIEHDKAIKIVSSFEEFLTHFDLL